MTGVFISIHLFFFFLNFIFPFNYTVSKTLEEFQRRLKLDKTHIRNLRTAFRAVHSGNEAAMEKFGMPTRAWNEVVFFFSKLIDSGFIS